MLMILLFSIKTKTFIYQVENVLTKEFSTLCEWFVSNKLPYYLEKIKCVLFSKTENLSKSNITQGNHNTNQCHTVANLGCHLDSSLIKESMVMKFLKKAKKQNLNFSIGKTIFTPRLKRLLRNTLIQLHFNYECKSCFPLLNKYLRYKFQTAQNKCMSLFRFNP